MNGSETSKDKDFKTMSAEDFPYICRTCMNRGQLVPIFQSQVEGDVRVDWLLKKFAKLEVTVEDNMPQNICTLCYARLMKMYNFQKKCHLNDLTIKLFSNTASAKHKAQPEPVGNSEHDLAESDNDDQENDYEQEASKEPVGNSERNHIESDDDNQQNDDAYSSDSIKIDESCLDEDFIEKIDEDSQENADSLEHQNNANAIEVFEDMEFADEKPDGERSRDESVSEGDSSDDGKKNPVSYVYICKDCFKAFSSLEELTAHKKVARHPSNKKKPFKNGVYSCKDCDMMFDSFPQMKAHRIETQHPKFRTKYPCQVCGKYFNKWGLRLHMRSHTNEKPYKCNYCNQAFGFDRNRQRHEQIHLGQRPYLCELCGRSFIQLGMLETHKKSRHSEAGLAINLPNLILCPICCGGFRTTGVLEKHMRKYHFTTFDENDTSSYQKLTSTKGVSNNDEMPYTCSTCDRSFKYLSSLKAHNDTHEKPYHCAHCEKHYGMKHQLITHLRTHTGEKPYKCTVCSKTFNQPNHLKYHQLLHTGERPHTCPICGKSFTMKGTLTVHIRTHTGETPYLCSVCGKGFYDSTSRKKHEKKHV